MAFRLGRRGFSWGLGALALLTVGCSSDKVAEKKSPTTTKDKNDAGAPPAPTWTNQAFDVQSTWHDTTETTLSTGNVDKLVHLWAQPIGNESTVAVVGNRIYATASSGVYALDADTGATIWQQAGTADQGIGTTASPTYEDGVLYIDNGGGGLVFALDATTGDVLWKSKIEYHPQAAGYSTPIIYGDSLFVGVASNEEVGTTANATFKGSVVALDKKTGDVLWQTATASDNENGCAVWSTVALDPIGGTVFGATGNNYTEDPGGGSDSIYAFDMKTGDIKWHTQVTKGDVFTINNARSPDSDFGANPVVYDYQKKHLVAAGQKSGNVYVFDRADGTILATRLLGGGSAFIGGVFQALAFDGDHLLVVNNQSSSTDPGSEPSNGDSTGTGVLFALDPLTLDIVWERQLPAWSWAPLTVANGVGYVGAETHLEAFDVKDGTKLFDYQAVGTIIGAPVINNGRIYVPSGLSYIFGHPDNKLHAFALPDDPAVGKQPGGGTGPDTSAPTFTNVYKTVIAKNCIQSQCHGSTETGNLAMANQSDAYKNLVGVTASGTCSAPDAGGDAHITCGCATSGKVRVVAGQPKQSLLVEKLSGTPSCGDRMPPTGDPLPDDQQNLVKEWITSGAKND